MSIVRSARPHLIGFRIELGTGDHDVYMVDHFGNEYLVDGFEHDFVYDLGDATIVEGDEP